MWDKIVTSYRKVEMGFVSGASGISSNVIDETLFYDVGYIQTQIDRTQKLLNRITLDMEAEVTNTSRNSLEWNNLVEKRENLIFRIIFLASNSFNNLEDCKRLATNYSFPFIKCVEALDEYKNGNSNKAFTMLESYYKEYKSVEGHYLVNKTFGLLLAERDLYSKAISFLTYALQFLPDDVECLESLKDCYEKMGNVKKETVIKEVLEVLR